MSFLREESTKYRGKRAFPSSKAQVTPFDVETTFTELTEARKKRKLARRYRGTDSPLYSAVFPLVCIMKIIGLAPYDFTADEMTPSNACLAFSFAFVGIYSYIIYMVYMRFTVVKRSSVILSTVENTKVAVNFFVVMYELIWTMLTRGTFTRIWNDLQNLDAKLSQLGYPRKETKTVIATWSLLISQTIIWTLVNQSGMYAFNESWPFNVSYMFLYVSTAVSVFKFFGMVSFLGQRFGQLNRIARENLPPRLGYKSTTASRKTIQDLHNALMISSEAFGSLYSWSLLFWLGNLSVHSVSNLYFIIDWTLLTPWSQTTFPHILRIFNMWSWLIAFTTQLLAIHIGCDYAITEANSIAAILVEWDARIGKRFPYDNGLASLQYLNRRLHFTAGGLFDVKLSLLSSIVGMMSTYLIILLQFPS
ncbi:putative gustatory receptor 2a [Xylocopa sonorina]|uniref:putative gustatory receptor 2a n=1 Tax=Xylocopa sonorina TaxID=1818115 RepID=UPI00403AD340